MSAVRLPRRYRYPTVQQDPDSRWANQLVRDLNARDQEVNNALTVLHFSDTFLITATGVITVSFTTVLNFTPYIGHTQISLAKSTAVTDWAYDWLWVDSVSSTSIVGKIKIGTASATGGAKARMNIFLRFGDAIDELDSA